MKVTPFLFFEGRCEEALEFYRARLGATVGEITRYEEQEGGKPSAMKGKVMHASFVLGETTVWASDGNGARGAAFNGFALSLTAADVKEAERMFEALSDGGEVREPLGEAFFAERFGMVTDRFGVLWMVMV